MQLALVILVLWNRPQSAVTHNVSDVNVTQADVALMRPHEFDTFKFQSPNAAAFKEKVTSGGALNELLQWCEFCHKTSSISSHWVEVGHIMWTLKYLSGCVSNDWDIWGSRLGGQRNHDTTVSKKKSSPVSGSECILSEEINILIMIKRE